jgi:hypothetical protein
MKDGVAPAGITVDDLVAAAPAARRGLTSLDAATPASGSWPRSAGARDRTLEPGRAGQLGPGGQAKQPTQHHRRPATRTSTPGRASISPAIRRSKTTRATTVAAPASPTGPARVRATRVFSLRTVLILRVSQLVASASNRSRRRSGTLGRTGPDAAQHATAFIDVDQADRDIQQPDLAAWAPRCCGPAAQPRALVLLASIGWSVWLLALGIGLLVTA